MDRKGMNQMSLRKSSKSLFNSLYRYHVCDQQEDEQLIKEQLDTEGDRGLAEYIRNRILRQKVFRMFPDVEVWQGELWGVLEIESYGKLSDTELNAVIAEWSGQASDGWGEGFEQRPIRTEEGDLYVSFWNSGSDYFITTEEKLKDASLRHSDVGRGGIGMRMG